MADAIVQTAELRRSGIGGSDAGTIAGVDPYKTELELYYEKRGEIEIEDISDTEHVRFGNLLEDVIAQEYARRMEVKVRRINRTMRHKEYPWMMCHVDRDIVAELGILECKNTGAFRLDEWGEEMTDQVPERHLLQAQHNMAASNLSPVYCDIPVLMHGNRLRIYRIERDNTLIESLIEVEQGFWTCVQEGVSPPTVDFESRPAAYVDLLKKVHAGTSGEIRQITVELEPWHYVRAEAIDLIGQYEKARDVASAHLLRAMGDSAVLLLDDGTGYRRKLTKRKGFVVEPSEFIDFRLVKNPTGKAVKK